MINSQESVDRRPNLVLPLFVLVAVVANHALFRLGAMSPYWVIVLIGAVGALYVAAQGFHAPIGARLRPQLRFSNLVIGLIALAPVTASVLLSWNREFPFSGDSYFHVGQSLRLAFWWLSPVGSDVLKVPTLEDVRHLAVHPWNLGFSRIVCLAAIAMLSVWLYRRRRDVALGFATIALIAWGLSEASIFLRYPGGGYLLDLPFIGAALAFDRLELAGRLSGVSAAFVWLFALRPWLIGRWPDLRFLPVTVLLLWHKDVIYYFDSVYLEPWGVILALLAVELMLEKGRDAAPMACLLVGTAAAVKEPFILALPFVWIAGVPWRNPRQDFFRLTAAAFAAGLPFVFYFAARRSVDMADMGADRTLRFGLSVDGLARYAEEFGHQMRLAFPGSSGVFALAALLAIPILLWLRPDRRLALTSLVAAGLVIGLMFVVDAQSQRWAGYFRFLLYSLPFLTAGLILFSTTVRPNWALAVGGLALLLQAPSAYTALARALGPATDRNFVEHYDSPIVFPTRSLIAEAERAGVLRHQAPIHANLVDGTIRPLPRSPVSYGPLGELYCTCTPAFPNVLTLFVRFTNMSAAMADRPARPDSRIALWQKTNAQRPACLAELRRSCGHVFTRYEGGELVGALGTAN